MKENNMYKKLPPFKWFVLQNFPFIEEDFDAITNYQLLCKIIEYLNLNINKTNELGEQVEALTNWFDNLDVQDEVDNKLDEMAEQGILTELITAYLNLKCILAYNTISDMSNATNLIDGSYVKTYGRNTLNDGGGAFYYVRPIENTDVVDGINIVALNDTSLVAEKVTEIEKRKILSQMIDTSIIGQIYTNDIGKGSNGLAIADNHIYGCGSDGTTTNSGFIVKINLTSGKRTMLQNNLNIGHANGMCYCEKDGFLYIACSGGTNSLPQISVYNTDLQFIKNIDFTNIGSGNAWGIAYNSNKDVFYVLSGGQILEMNYALDTVINVKNLEPIDVETVGQSLYCDDNYIYYVYNINYDINGRTSLANRIDVYDINTLEYVTTQKLSILGEVESGYCYNGYTYFMRLSQNIGVIFKASNYENNKVLNYLHNNIIVNKEFPSSGQNYSIYVNSNYTNFYSDGTENNPFNNLWLTMSLIYDLPISNLDLHLIGDFSNYDLVIRNYNRNIRIYGTSGTLTKVGGINIASAENIRIENIELVKRTGSYNHLLTSYNVKLLDIRNIKLNGQGTETAGVFLENTFCRISNIEIANSFANNGQAIELENNAGLYMSGSYTSSVSNAGVTANTKGTVHLPYRFPLNMASYSTAWDTNVIGGGVSFYLRDIKLPGKYRIEGENICQDAPSGYTTNAGRFIVDFVEDAYIYKFIPINSNKLFIGIKSGNQSDITWKEVV
jgi:hypothetical protein